MTVSELIHYLSNFDENTQVMILDGYNGGGYPREINLKSTHTISEQDAADTADCEDIVDTEVIVLGYGCY